MSVQFAPSHGLKQKLTPAVKMAVGSSVDPAGATIARSAGIHPKQSDNHCYGLPYQDHNYGAPPPPTPPQSPMPSITDPAEASVFNAVNTGSCDKFSEAPTVTIKCVKAPQKNDFIQSTTSLAGIHDNNISPDAVNGNSSDLTRCICGFVHDDGYMICCDRCSVWQHIDCMQIDRNSIPETYLCEKCNPRYLDREKAARLQRKKHEEFISCAASDFDSLLSGSGEESCDNVLYTAIHSTPTSITLSTNRKRNQLNHQLGKKRKRSADTIKTIKNNDASKRQRSKSLLVNEVQNDYGPLKCLWRMKLKQWSKSYQEAEANKYSDSCLNALSGSLARNSENTESKSADVLALLQAQLAKVQILRNTLLALEDIQIGQPIIEYQGSFTLAKQFEVPTSKIYERPYPYVLFYSGFDGLDICVDARTYGNKARFIRRSCSPNAEVRHILDKGLLRLFIYSSKLIEKETEITLPFDIKYENCSYTQPCACSTKGCPVHKSNQTKLQMNEMRSNNNSHKRLAPLRLSLKLPHHQINGYASSEDGNTTCDTEENADNQRKKSREERKMEAYIRAFEKLEKKEKRRELLQQQSQDKSITTSEDAKPLLSPSSNSLSITTVATTVTVLSNETTPISKVDSSSQVPTTSAPQTVPQKRIVRRRSGRVRRGSRKYHGEIYQTSTNSSRLEPTTPSDAFVPFSEDSCDSANQEVAKLMPSVDQPEFTSFTTLPSASLPSVPPLSWVPVSDTHTTFATLRISSNTENFIDTSTTSKPISSVIPTTVILETSKGEVFHSAFSPTVPLEHCNVSMYNFESRDMRTDLCAESGDGLGQSDGLNDQKLLPNYMFLGRSRSSSGNSKFEESSTPRSTTPTTKRKQICTKPIYPTVSCSVVPWDFKPGTPRGMVPINVRCSSRYSRYISSKPVKKWWLQRAVNDCLALSSISAVDTEKKETQEPLSTHSSPLPDEVKDANHVLPWKKRLLNENSEKEPDVSDCVETVDIAQDADDVEKDVDNEACASDSVAEPTVPEVDTEEVNETVETVDEDQPLLSELKENTKEDDVMIANDEPAQAVVDQPSVLPDSTPVAEMQQEYMVGRNAASAAALPHYITIQQQASDEMNYLFDETSCESAVGQYENVSDLRFSQRSPVYPAPVKRKVSLQEYLKRSKETKKPSSSTTTSLSTLPPTSTSTVPTTTRETKKLCAETSSTPTLLTPSHIETRMAKPAAKLEPNQAPLSVLCNEKVKPDAFKQALSALNKNKEVMGLVSKVVNHLKATERTKAPVKPEDPRPNAPKLEKQSSYPPTAKSTANNSTPSSPVLKAKVRKSTSESKMPINFQLSRKLDPGNSPTMNKSFARKLNMSSSPRCEPARDQDKNKMNLALKPNTPTDVKSGQPMDIAGTPTLRSPAILCRDDVWSSEIRGQPRSRHGSGASSSSSRSPKHYPETHGVGRYHKSTPHHQPLSRSGSENNSRSSEPGASPTLPQKVPCITPAVPGQPIPSLVRSGDGRGPLAVYSRPSPTRDYRGPSPPPPRWQHSPPFVARNGCSDVGRIPDRYTESPSPTYSSKYDSRYYEPDHRSTNRDYYRYDDHPPPHLNYPHPNQPRHYSPALSRRYSNEGYPPRRTPSPQMFHYRHNNPAAQPPYYADSRTSYQDDQRDRGGHMYRYHKPHPGGTYGRSPPDSPNSQHRRHPSPGPYQSGPGYRSHYSGGYRT